MWWSGCKLNLPMDVYDSGKTLCHLSLSLALDTSYHLVFQNITSVITLCQMALAGHSTSGVESGKWMDGRKEYRLGCSRDKNINTWKLEMHWLFGFYLTGSDQWLVDWQLIYSILCWCDTVDINHCRNVNTCHIDIYFNNSNCSAC